MYSMGSSSEGKSRAQDFRLAYFRQRKASGDPLQPVESDYFRDASGTRVGVTWSKKHDAGKWFLNLMEDKFDAAVLLCQLEPNESIAVRVPRDVVRRYWHSWSRDEKREVKFRVVRQRGRFFLQVPEPVGLVEADGFVERDRVVVDPPVEYV
jgi:hypothetical protein